MGMRINGGALAITAHRNLAASTARYSRSLERVSSGLRINRAADDAAGLRIAERLRSQVGGLAQAQRNAQDGISMCDTAEGALAEIHSMLQRVRDLAVQYANGTSDVNARKAISAEARALRLELVRVATKTTFNGIKVTSSTGTVKIQVGANKNQTINVKAQNANSVISTLNINAKFPTSGGAQPANTLTAIDTAISSISTQRMRYGAAASRLEHALRFAETAQSAAMAAESRIRDADIATELTQVAREQIVQQGAAAMLGQANQSSASVLALLQ